MKLQHLCLSLALVWSSATCTTLYFEPHQQKVAESYPFQNVSLPWEDRVNDLVGRLTLEELQEQLARGGAGQYGGPAPAIKRLGIGPYNWDTECLRGDVGAPGNATAFPQAIGLAATFSPNIIFRVADATGREVRGKHNDFVHQGIYNTHTGASCFSPVINIARDARWGRNQETYGEDPYLSGVMAENFVRGLQGGHERYVMASAGCKHFDVHGGPEDIPVSRMSFDAEVSERDWRMTFLPAFRRCVMAGSFSLMCSYNRLNGVPSCANGKLLTDILRTEWGFKGYVVSDESAIENIISRHHYLNNSVDTAAACVNAGTNLELSPNLKTPVYFSIVDAVKQGKLTEDMVRERAKPLFYTRMRLGEFDPPEMNPYSKLDGRLAESQEHRLLAVEAAIKSFVLLKNEQKVLPLKVENYKSVAIVGPMADNVEQLFGDYSPQQSRSFTMTPLQGIQTLYPNVKTGKACQDGTPCTKYDPNVVESTVKGADLVFLALGTGQAVEAEGRDRENILLPGNQMELVFNALYPSGEGQNATVIVLLFNAGPLNISMFSDNPGIHAIMACFLPAQATGEALAAVLTNRDDQGPAGRLPMTWPIVMVQMPPITNYSMVGRTYRYIESAPLYPFGYGLSYSEFRYENLEIRYRGGPQEDLVAFVDVRNVGDVNAEEVIQCYIQWGDKSLPVPNIQLVHFERLWFRAGYGLRLSILVSWESWSYWEDSQWKVAPGEMTLSCGGQQPGQKTAAPSNVLSQTFTIYTGAKIKKL